MLGLTPFLISLLINTHQVGERIEWVLVADPSECIYQLPFITDTTEEMGVLLVGSDSVWIDDVLVSRADYLIDPQKQEILIFSKFPEFTAIRVVYRVVNLGRIASSRKPLIFKPEAGDRRDSVKIVARFDSLSSIPPGNWQVSGNKSLGFSINTDAGLAIEQATRVTLSGEIENIEIQADLSDQNPSFPVEGTTLELEELDKIMISVKGQRWKGAFGNIDINTDAGGFGKLQRNVIGGMIEGQTEGISVSAAYARPKGEWGRVILKGIEGIQGPYILLVDGRTAQIVPGSEVVYLNGQRMTRGWDADYTIDYATGEIVFTNRNIITTQSRIEVEFQFLTFNYERSTVAGEIDALPGPFQVHLTLFQEGDNPERALNSDLSEKAKEKLAEIAKDTNRAWIGGGEFVGSGNGDYILEGNFYRFVGKNAGDYRVRFTYVGESLGSYIYDDSLLGFRYVGPKTGNYVDSIKISPPKLQQLAYVRAGYKYQGVDGFIEGSFLRRNLNLFAGRLGALNSGGLNYGVSWSQERFSVRYRHKGKTESFFLPGGSEEIDFTYYWGQVMPYEFLTTDEIVLRTVLSEVSEFNVLLGRLKKLDNSYIERYGGEGRIRWLTLNGFRAGNFFHFDAGMAPPIFWVYPVVRWVRETDKLNRTSIWQAGIELRPGNQIQLGGNYQITGFEKQDTSVKSWKNQGREQIVQLKFKQEAGALFQINGLIGYQSCNYIGSENDWRKYFGSFNGNLSPCQGMNFSFDISQSNRLVRLKDEIFRYVGPNKGTYRRDSLTGGYTPDAHGDYELLVVYRNNFSDVRDFAMTANVNWISTYSVDFSGYFTHHLGASDSSQLSLSDLYNLRLNWNALEPLFKVRTGLEGGVSSDRTLRITGQKVKNNSQFVELMSAFFREVDLIFRTEHKDLVRRLHTGELDYEENGWLLELTPIIKANVMIELGFFGERKWLSEPLDYPELGKFSLNSTGTFLTRTFTFGKHMRIKPRGEIIYRWTVAPYLPFDIELTQPLGTVPSFRIELEHLWGENFSLSARYSFSNPPHRLPQHNFSMSLQANF